MTPTTINIVSSAIFAVAVIHTFSTKFFEHLAHKYPNHSGIWHLLGEVEVVFGFAGPGLARGVRNGQL